MADREKAGASVIDKAPISEARAAAAATATTRLVGYDVGSQPKADAGRETLRYYLTRLMVK